MHIQRHIALTAALAALSPALAAQTIVRFDMGQPGSPTVPGYSRVYATSVYNSTLGFGWLSAVSGGFDVSAIDARIVHNLHPSLIRDGNYAPTGSTFRVGGLAPNALHDCVVYLGDVRNAGAVQGMSIVAQNVTVASGLAARTTTAKAGFHASLGGYRRVAFVTAADGNGQIDITFGSAGAQVPVIGVQVYPHVQPPVRFDHTAQGLVTSSTDARIVAAVGKMNTHEYDDARAELDAAWADLANLSVDARLALAWGYAWWVGWLTGAEADVDPVLLRDPLMPGGPGIIESLLTTLDQNDASVALLLAETRDFAWGELFLATRAYSPAAFPENPRSILLPTLGVGDIKANSGAGVQLLEQMDSDILKLQADPAQTQSPYFAKARLLLARNMYGRNTHVATSVDEGGLQNLRDWDRYFLDQYDALWTRLDPTPSNSSARIYPKAIDPAVQAWRMRTYVDDDLDTVYPGRAMQEWNGVLPPFSQSEFDQAWWAPRVNFTGASGLPGWATHQWAYGRMLRQLARWWIEKRSKGVGGQEWGGGAGDDAEVAGVLGSCLIIMQEGSDNAVEKGVAAVLEGSLLSSEVNVDQGYWDGPGGIIDAEHGGEFTTYPLRVLTSTNFGDPFYLEFAMRCFRNMDEQVDAHPWTGIAPFTPASAPVGLRHFKAMRFGANAIETSGNGNFDVDFVENIKAVIPGLSVLAYSGNTRVEQIWREYAHAWAHAAAHAAGSNLPLKPAGVLPPTRDFVTGDPGDSGFWYWVPQVGEVNGGQPPAGGAVGLNFPDIYATMVELHRRTGDIELIQALEQLMAFMAGTYTNSSPGSDGWTQSKLNGVIGKIALDALPFLSTTGQGAANQLVCDHGDAYSRYLNRHRFVCPAGTPSKDDVMYPLSLYSEWLRYFWPFATTAVTYTDRVATGSYDGAEISGQALLHFTRSGAPFRFGPSQAFTYYDPLSVGNGQADELDFTVLVNDLDLDAAENGGLAARLLLCNQGPTARRVGIRPWQLPLGDYDVHMGRDADFDDLIDLGSTPISFDLSHPGEPLISALVGPGQIYVVEFRLQTERSLSLLPDPAVGPRDISLGANGSVIVRVHNVGAAATGSIRVTVQKSGDPVSAAVAVASIPAPLDLQPRFVDVTVPYNAVAGDKITAFLNVVGGQITTANDSAKADL
ncbi:MAG: hypothetical protein R3F56_07075 [Planctomycetota bacterium]